MGVCGKFLPFVDGESNQSVTQRKEDAAMSPHHTTKTTQYAAFLTQRNATPLTLTLKSFGLLKTVRMPSA